MIIEGIVTTLEPNGQANISPMGPLLDLEARTIELRPFGSSRTLQNLLARPSGVFHLTDDALLIVQAVTKRWVERPEMRPADTVAGWVLPQICSWHEFQCGYIDQSSNRAVITARIVQSGSGIPFRGLNRARHALLEAAIAISRLQFLPHDEIAAALQTAARLCDKTGGPRERLALEVLELHFSESRASDSMNPKDVGLPSASLSPPETA